MQNIKQLGAIIFFLLFTSDLLYSQSTPYCLGEEVKLKTLETYRGNYHWEFSPDNNIWNTVSENTEYTFILNSQTAGYYRLRISEADCEDVISDFQQINFSSTVTDIEGNSYAVFQFNNQCWMAENLRTSKYNDESVIQEISNANNWISLNSGAWCNLDNSTINNVVHGKLYN
jgi:hypothetical protein